MLYGGGMSSLWNRWLCFQAVTAMQLMFPFLWDVLGHFDP